MLLLHNLFLPLNYKNQKLVYSGVAEVVPHSFIVQNNSFSKIISVSVTCV